jgi:hypothetical protein
MRLSRPHLHPLISILLDTLFCVALAEHVHDRTVVASSAATVDCLDEVYHLAACLGEELGLAVTGKGYLCLDLYAVFEGSYLAWNAQ